MNPDKHEVPTEPSVCYALCGALAARSSADNFDNVLTFVRRMSPEFTVLTVLDATRRDPNIQDTKAFLVGRDDAAKFYLTIGGFGPTNTEDKLWGYNTQSDR